MIDETYTHLHELAVELYRLGMRQAAGDFDYLASWLDSANWKGQNGVRVGVIPSGENSPNRDSNLPPIPCFSSNDIERCSDPEAANTVLTSIYQCVKEIKETSTDVDVISSIDCFKEYTAEVIEENGGEPPVEPVSESSIYCIIDRITGEETKCNEPPGVSYIDKVGTMFVSDRQLVNYNIYGCDIIDKGGTMFTSTKTLVDIGHYGIQIIGPDEPVITPFVRNGILKLNSPGNTEFIDSGKDNVLTIK